MRIGVISTLIPVVVGSVLGFAGGVVFWVYQDRTQRAVEKENITRALLVEVRHINNSLKKHRKWWKNLEPTGWLPPLVPFATPAYDHLADKIGLIDKDDAEDIVKYHGYTFFINSLQELKDEYAKKNKGTDFHDQYLNTLNEQIDRGEKFLERFSKKFP